MIRRAGFWRQAARVAQRVDGSLAEHRPACARPCEPCYVCVRGRADAARKIACLMPPIVVGVSLQGSGWDPAGASRNAQRPRAQGRAWNAACGSDRRRTDCRAGPGLPSAVAASSGDRSPGSCRCRADARALLTSGWGCFGECCPARGEARCGRLGECLHCREEPAHLSRHSMHFR